MVDCLMGKLFEFRNEIGYHMAMEPVPWRSNLIVPSGVSSGEQGSTNWVGHCVLSMEGIDMVLSY